jgi:hypothetical protein
MKKIKIATFIFFVGFSCLFTSCEEDSTATLSEDIKNIVPESTLTKITDLGMPVNKGTNPTNLVNFYKVSPLTLKATNIPSDYTVGYVFADYKFRLYDQDNTKLSIKFDYISGSETGTGLGGFISGEGNDFSVFVKVHSTSSGSPAEVIHIISGTITSDGIKNFYFSNFMLDDYGDPKNVWMANDQGRVFYDSDGLSPKVSSLQAISFSKFQTVSAGSENFVP